MFSVSHFAVVSAGDETELVVGNELEYNWHRGQRSSSI